MVRKIAKQLVDDQLNYAPRAVLEDMFEDLYKNRHQLYWMNFIRGIFFGFGSVIGGTAVVALLVWLLSLFHFVPFVDGIVDTVQSSLRK